MIQQLLPSLGFGWAVRCCAFLALGVAGIGLSLLSRIKPNRAPFTRQLIDRSSFWDRPFMFFTVSGFFAAVGYFVVLVYLPTFTTTHLSDKVPSGLPFYILSIANGTSTFSRIGAGFMATRFGPFQLYVTALGVCVLLAFTWISVHTVAGLLIWTVLWGMASGLIVSLPGSIVPLFTPKPTLIGTRMGIAVSTWGIGMLVGSPAAGAIVAQPGPNTAWWPLQILVGISMVVSFLLCVQPLMHIRAKQRCVTREDKDYPR